MCEKLKVNMCLITNDRCPYTYYCNNEGQWKPSKSMPINCKIKRFSQTEAPEGFYCVREERKGYLYVDIGDTTYKLKNPFDYIPAYVKITKTKNGYKIRK